MLCDTFIVCLHYMNNNDKNIQKIPELCEISSFVNHYFENRFYHEDSNNARVHNLNRIY